jgi:HEAT repeat protein
MVAINVVQRFRQQNDLRTYRRKILADIHQDPVVRLLPALLELPLECMCPDGDVRPIERAVAGVSRVALMGGLGSGRRLVLQQLAQRWAGMDNGPLPMLLPLAMLDDNHSTPDELIAAWLARSTRAETQKSPLLNLPGLSPSPPTNDHFAGWSLLVDGWEELPDDRQDVWRAALQAAPQSWPDAQMIVALPIDEPLWPDFTGLTITPPSPATLDTWLARLLPEPHRTVALTELRASRPLQAMSSRLAEIALMAWVMPQVGLPGTRADLYARTVECLVRQYTPAPPIDRLFAELRLLAAYGEPPTTSMPDMLRTTADGGVWFAHALLRHYFAARQLVAETRYDLLGLLSPVERLEVARFATTITDDPAQLYTALWRNGRPSADDLLILGECLRDQVSLHPSWTMRIIGALALLARDGRPPHNCAAEALLPELMPALSEVFYALPSVGASKPILQILTLLPPQLAVAHAERLAYRAETDPQLAWELADSLTTNLTLQQQTNAPTEAAGLDRWVYVQALGETAQRGRLFEPGDAHTLKVLAASPAGEMRVIRAASAIISDTKLPASARIAGLELLTGSSHVAALGVIERACYDPMLEIRQAALAKLVNHDSADAHTSLSRTALDRDVPWNTRLDAIQRLATMRSSDIDAVMAKCARDAELSLYARLLSVIALKSADAGEQLEHIVQDEALHVEVRAAAGRGLGMIGRQNALPHMLELLDDDSTPPGLRIGLCRGLGAMNDIAAIPSLLRLLRYCAADTELTLAVIHALGMLRAETSVDQLGALLGEGALLRLHSAVADFGLQQSVEALLDSGGLPMAMAQRLDAARAISVTIADRPTTLNEFLIHEADVLRSAAADALVTIGSDAAKRALTNALIDGATGGATGKIVEAIAQIDGANGPAALGALLTTPEVQSPARWLIVECLRDHPEGEEALRRTLALPEVDVFTRGAIAEALGQRKAISALPILRQLADDPHGDAYLRSQAVLGLGLLDDPAAEVVLIRLIGSTTEDVPLRGLAAEHLPTRVSPEGRRFLRDMLRRERPPAPIAVGALQALGKAQDREALPLLLRYCQDDPAPVAQAALVALAQLGDSSIAPVLVRVVQNPNIDQATRLQAVGTLLRLGGAGYRPLLKAYLENSPLPLRLQALEHLIDADAPLSELLEMLSSRAWPLPVRLRLLERCAGEASAVRPLLHILRDVGDNLQLRGLVAEALGRHPQAGLSFELAALAGDSAADVELRLRCINALQMRGEHEAYLALSRLAEGDDSVALVCSWATRALVTASVSSPVHPSSSEKQ